MPIFLAHEVHARSPSPAVWEVTGLTCAALHPPVVQLLSPTVGVVVFPISVAASSCSPALPMLPLPTRGPASLGRLSALEASEAERTSVGSRPREEAQRAVRRRGGVEARQRWHEIA